MIKSEMNGKVLDIEGGSDAPGTDVIMWHPKDELSDNQLWYEDRKGNIRSKLHDFCLDSSGGYPSSRESNLFSAHEIPNLCEQCYTF